MASSERYFFVHLQKTAGTSLTGELRAMFGTDAVYPPVHGRPDDVLDVDRLLETLRRDRGRLRVIAGHFPYCTTELLSTPVRTFTILREPLARTLSFLRHRQQLDPELADATLEEIYGRPTILHGLVHNHMVKMLGLTPQLMTRGALTLAEFDHSYLRRAKENLDRIDVWGLQSDYDRFRADLESEFGWTMGPPRRSNATGPGQPVSEAFAARILRDNALDVDLYRYAEEKARASRTPAPSTVVT